MTWRLNWGGGKQLEGYLTKCLEGLAVERTVGVAVNPLGGKKKKI